MKKKLFQRHKRKFVTFGSAMGTAGIMYTVWGGSIFMLAALFVVMVHELGHMIAAYQAHANVGYTFFIPLIFGILGATQIRNIPPDKEGRIAIFGPIFGVLAALLVGLFVFVLEMETLFIPSLLLVLFELFNLFVGSDAKKYRRAKNRRED